MTQQALTGGDIYVCIEESAGLRIIVPGLQVIEATVGVVYVATVAQRIDICVGAGSGDRVAVRVVFVVGGGIAIPVYQPNNVTLQVRNVIVVGVVAGGSGAVPHGDGRSVDVVEEIKDVVPIGHPGKLRTDIVIGIDHTVDGLRCTQAIRIVGVGDVVSSAGCCCQLPPVLPAKRPTCAVVVALRVA